MYYRYRQNNSGGRFNTDAQKGISQEVYIEAGSEDEADAIAQGVGIYFHGVRRGVDCSCCGDRWHEVNDWDVSEDYPEFIQVVYGVRWITDAAAAYVHKLDGTIIPIEYVDHPTAI